MSVPLWDRYFEAESLDEPEVIESPDGDPRKRGEIRVAHKLEGDAGHVIGPVEPAAPLSACDHFDEGPLTPGMFLQAEHNDVLFQEASMPSLGSLRYASEQEVRQVIDAVKDIETRKRRLR